jgi:hypothetical protein
LDATLAGCFVDVAGKGLRKVGKRRSNWMKGRKEKLPLSDESL